MKKIYIGIGVVIIMALLIMFGYNFIYNKSKARQCHEEFNNIRCSGACFQPTVESSECATKVIINLRQCELCGGEWVISPCMPNPASWFCLCMGGKCETKTSKEGGQYGTCKFFGLIELNEWNYFDKVGIMNNI